MSRLTRDGMAEPVSQDQILRHARGEGNIHFPCSADHEQDWQPYPVDPYFAICDDHTYIHTYPNLLLVCSEPVIFRNLYHIFVARVGTFSGSFLFLFIFIFSVPYFGLACDHGNSFLCLEE